MPAVVTLELVLDPPLEDAVRAEWDALAAAGVSSLAARTAPSHRPHVTLLVREELRVLTSRDIPLVGPVPILLGGLVLFGQGERRVLARSVVPSLALLALHAAVHEAAGPCPDAPHTRPGSWTPHVTLARRLRVTDLARALGALGGELGGALSGSVSGVRRWDAATSTVTTLVDVCSAT